MSDPDRRQILVLGGKKSGKTSCIRTVFADLPQKETAWLEMTTRVTKTSFESIIPLDIYDTPANFDPLEEIPTLPTLSLSSYPNPPNLDLTESSSNLLNGIHAPTPAGARVNGDDDVVLPSWGEISTVIYVVDLQADFTEASRKIADVFVMAHAYNPEINLEVFAHKADGLSGEYQDDYFRELSQCVEDEIYDIKISEFFPAPLATSPTMRNSPSRHGRSNSQSHTGQAQSQSQGYAPPRDLPTSPEDEKRFIDDVIAQLGIRVTSVQDSSVYEAWSRIVQNLMEGIYGEVEKFMNTFLQTSGMDKCYLFDINAKIYLSMDASPQEANAFELCSDFLGRLLAFQSLYSKVPEARKVARQGKSQASDDDAEVIDGKIQGVGQEDEEEDPDEVEWPTQLVRLGDSATLAYWQFDRRLALICLVRSDIFDEQQGMIEYNVTLLRAGLLRMLEALGR